MDIEDIGNLPEIGAARLDTSTSIQPKQRRRRRDRGQTKSETPVGVPRTESVWIKTWGCSHNNSDGEYMAGLLASGGYTITQNKDEADLWLLNSCTVKNPSQDTFVNAIKAGNSQQKKVVLAGCVSQAQPKHGEFVDHSIIGVQQIDRVVEVVEETLKGNSVRMLTQKKDGGARLHLPKIRKNPLIEIIPINTGCLNQCTYCKTKQARGDLRSYQPDEIVDRVKAVLDEGVVEIWLTSEDLGTYGRDIGTDLPTLLWRIVAELREGTMLRLGMTNPPYILEHLEEMGKILNHPRVYSFLHVPVQAASDHVLDDMRRKYNLKDFCRVVDYLVDHVPNMLIATDIICGFPTETAEDFEETLALVDKYRFPVLNISQFYPRPGTPAARMKRLNTAEVKRRSRALTTLFDSYTTRDKNIGKTMRVLVTEVARDKKHYVGHNKSYEQVLVPMKEELLGKMFDAKVTSCGKHFMMGDVVDTSVEEAPKTTAPLPAGALSRTDLNPELQEKAKVYDELGKTRRRRRRQVEEEIDAIPQASSLAPSANTPHTSTDVSNSHLVVRVGLLVAALLILYCVQFTTS